MTHTRTVTWEEVVRAIATQVKKSDNVGEARAILERNGWANYSDEARKFPTYKEGWSSPDGMPPSGIVFGTEEKVIYGMAEYLKTKVIKVEYQMGVKVEGEFVYTHV